MSRRGAGEPEPGAYAYRGLDRVLHEKARLGILTALLPQSVAAGVRFNDLKSLCDLTDGNLSRHLAVLADAGLIETERSRASGARAQTVVRLSAAGRAAFGAYLEELERVVRDARRGLAAEDGDNTVRFQTG